MRNGGLQAKAIKSLDAVSLSHSTQLREGEESNFRSYKEEVMRQRNIKMAWKQRAEEKFARGAEEKQEVAQVKERKRLTKMDELKGVGGPFTCADEVRLYLDKEELSEREKQKRLKKEVQFARESTTLPGRAPPCLVRIHCSISRLNCSTRRGRTRTQRSLGPP